jgi:hypothetical protein
MLSMTDNISKPGGSPERARSGGPRTEEGRRRVAFNAVRHGLTAKTVVLGNESEERYQELLGTYIANLQPQGELEVGFVEEIVSAKWRLRRLWGIETALLDVEMDRQEKEVDAEFESIDQAARLALAFRGLADESRSLALLSRYETRLQRTYDRPLTNLREAQKLRSVADQPELAPAPALPAPDAAPQTERPLN